MRHGKSDNHLGRTSQHRKALLMNMACSLILHKRIETTVAKARELRKYVEPLLTRGKDDTTHSRRTVFSYLKDKETLKELFGPIADKISTRNGGYTRIIKLGTRLGDNADMCLIELVDFNETMLAAKSEAKAKTRRSRRGGSTVPKAAAIETVAVAEEVVEAPVVDEVVETPVFDEVVDTPVAEVADDVTPEVTDETSSDNSADTATDESADSNEEAK